METWILVAALAALLLALDRQRRTHRALERLATTDALTALPNRTQLEPLLASAMAAARRRQKLAALALVDLDHFKDVNDGLGHALGDETLREVALRLRNFWPERHPVLRMGGDEFAIILHPLESQEGVLRTVRRLVEAFEPPFQLGSHQIYLSCSVGVATFPRDAEGAEQLLDKADWALYRAKRERGNSFQVFRPSMAVWVQRRLELEHELEAALAQDQLQLEFQPQVSLSDGSVVGVEALARWRHSTRGDIAPSVFIPLAEETGRIPRLGAWVTRRACMLAAQWQRDVGVAVPISVNVSIRQIQAGTLVSTVNQALEASGLAPALLRLELTANHAVRYVDKVHACVSALSDIGVGFTIDDFGTGYGSLDYLLRYPLCAVKIDGSFIAGIPSDRACATVVSAAVRLGRGLGLDVIAEGVETPAQLHFLRRSGCESAQGYLLCPPLPHEKFEAVLASRRIEIPAPLAQEHLAEAERRERLA
ncbi:MAG TPA: EAL domain-containing protein [Thermoanaerobaculia bacterium]|nr:EAL domain-containing protein [Thermoanaerobaculia bacterium]